MTQITGYGAAQATAPLIPMTIDRRPVGPMDVEIDIQFCGVCHSDIHQAKNEWHNTVYPCIPGHEIVGRVSAVGAEVRRFKEGDRVGVGCMIDSCGTCASCRAREEQYCESPNAFLGTYNGPTKPASATGGMNIYGVDNTFGGYSTSITVKEAFVLKVPETLPLDAAAPILCAGVTTYSPLKHWKVKAGDRVGVVGLGGLGDIAVKIAIAMGAEVYGFTTSPEKVATIRALGATAILETDKDVYADLVASFDLILSTIPEGHKIDGFLPLLKRDATYVALGAVEPMPGHDHSQLVMGRKAIAGSLIGSVAETQEVLDFCAEHGIVPNIQLIPMQNINDAYEALKAGLVEGRFVIDMASLKDAAPA